MFAVCPMAYCIVGACDYKAVGEPSLVLVGDRNNSERPVLLNELLSNWPLYSSRPDIHVTGIISFPL